MNVYYTAHSVITLNITTSFVSYKPAYRAILEAYTTVINVVVFENYLNMYLFQFITFLLYTRLCLSSSLCLCQDTIFPIDFVTHIGLLSSIYREYLHRVQIYIVPRVIQLRFSINMNILWPYVIGLLLHQLYAVYVYTHNFVLVMFLLSFLELLFLVFGVGEYVGRLNPNCYATAKYRACFSRRDIH